LELGKAARHTVSRFSIDSYIRTLSGVFDELASKLPGQKSVMLPSVRPGHEALAPNVNRVTDHADSALS